jgi:cell division protein FtsQ
LVLLVVAGLAYVALFSAALGVSQVTVEGAPEGRTDQIREAAYDAAETRYGALVSRSLLVLNEQTMINEIKRAQPDLDTVEVKKKWPNGVVVKVTERGTSLAWKSNNQTYLIDDKGTAFSLAGTGQPTLTVEDTANVPVEIGKPVAGTSFITFVQEAKTKLEAAGIKVTGFRVPETTFELQAVTDGGYYVLFDTTRPVGNQVDALVLALKAQKPREYADVRVPGRVYVK